MRKRHIHIHIHAGDSAWDESKHPRKDDGKFGAGASSSKRDELRAAAEAIAKMSDEKRDNTEIGDFPGAGAGYNLYEAQTMLPKPADKLKKVTDSNTFSLWQEYDYIANVDGTHIGVTKQEDPDADEDDDKSFIYAFQVLEEGGYDQKQTMTSDPAELFKEVREYLAKQGART